MSQSVGDDGAPALELRGIVKHFGRTQALNGVDLLVRPGTVHALLGENGAGKSTLMRIAYGLLSRDAGDLLVAGRAHERHSVPAAIAAGIGMVHQHLSLAPSLTAAENLVLGRRGRYSPRAAEAELERTGAAAGLSVPPATLARDLSIVEQQRLEILKTLARGARLLILDEPTAVLAPREIADLLEWVRRFTSTGGSVVLVTHKLREALAVSDDVTVLRRGEVTLTTPARTASEVSLATALFPGSEPTAGVAPVAPGATVASLRGVSIVDRRGARRVLGADLQLRRHELVGIAAVEGAGHRELLLALAGLTAVAQGEVQLPGRIAYIPADRLRDAVIPELSVTENVALRGAGSRRGLMHWGAWTDRARAIVTRFDITTPSPRFRAGGLSGGNQQRLVVGRELETDVDLVVADNPTRGLDLRATRFVHERLREAAARGAAVIVHSSDLDEVIALATRVVVVFDGGVHDVPLDRDAIGRAMVGVGVAMSRATGEGA